MKKILLFGSLAISSLSAQQPIKISYLQTNFNRPLTNERPQLSYTYDPNTKSYYYSSNPTPSASSYPSYSIASSSSNRSPSYSTNSILGRNNYVEGKYNIVNGQNNFINGQVNSLIGHSNQVSGFGNDIKGTQNQVSGVENNINGFKNSVYGQGNRIMSSGNRVDGNGNVIGQVDPHTLGNLFQSMRAGSGSNKVVNSGVAGKYTPISSSLSSLLTNNNLRKNPLGNVFP